MSRETLKRAPISPSSKFSPAAGLADQPGFAEMAYRPPLSLGERVEHLAVEIDDDAAAQPVRSAEIALRDLHPTIRSDGLLGQDRPLHVLGR